MREMYWSRSSEHFLQHFPRKMHILTSSCNVACIFGVLKSIIKLQGPQVKKLSLDHFVYLLPICFSLFHHLLDVAAMLVGA